MKKLLVLFLLQLISCASLVPKSSPQEGKRVFSYTDTSGRYRYVREQKLLKNKLITRSQIVPAEGNSSKPLEKSVMISQLGTIKDKSHRTLVIRPYASDFTVWLEGKKYESKIRLDIKNQSMIVEVTSPEKKWNDRSIIPFPKGKQFCFFSQIPDCLYHNLYLKRSLENKDKTFSFFVIWDSYPFIQEQLSGIGSKLFVPASLKFEGEDKSVMKFQVEVGGQTVLYHFSKAFDLVRMFWIGQGISVVPPGEELPDAVE